VGTFFGLIFGVWMIGTFVSWPYFWYKKTDRSQAPIIRRGMGLAYGAAWPYMVVKHFTGQQQAQAAESQRRATEQRIIGGEPAAATQPSPAQPQARIQNPFDN
jgi:hypothetical protein